MYLFDVSSEKGGLYFFDTGRRFVYSSIIKCDLSKCIWHNRLGYPSDQVLSILKNRINVDNISEI